MLGRRGVRGVMMLPGPMKWRRCCVRVGRAGWWEGGLEGCCFR